MSTPSSRLLTRLRIWQRRRGHGRTTGNFPGRTSRAEEVTRPTEKLPLERLRLRLGGRLYEGGDAEYVDACTLFNAMSRRQPQLVARCTTPEDVIAAVGYARE